jgi:hypothetical protein
MGETAMNKIMMDFMLNECNWLLNAAKKSMSIVSESKTSKISVSDMSRMEYAMEDMEKVLHNIHILKEALKSE